MQQLQMPQLCRKRRSLACDVNYYRVNFESDHDSAGNSSDNDEPRRKQSISSIDEPLNDASAILSSGLLGAALADGSRAIPPETLDQTSGSSSGDSEDGEAMKSAQETNNEKPAAMHLKKYILKRCAQDAKLQKHDPSKRRLSIDSFMSCGFNELQISAHLNPFAAQSSEFINCQQDQILPPRSPVPCPFYPDLAQGHSAEHPNPYPDEFWADAKRSSSPSGSSTSSDDSDGLGGVHRSGNKRRLEEKRSRNREAARRCRRKKIERISELEQKKKHIHAEMKQMIEVLDYYRYQYLYGYWALQQHSISGCFSRNPTAPVVSPIVAPVSEPVSAIAEPVSAIHEPVSQTTGPVSSIAEPVSAIHEPISQIAAPVSLIAGPISPVGMPVPPIAAPVFPALNYLPHYSQFYHGLL